MAKKGLQAALIGIVGTLALAALLSRRDPAAPARAPEPARVRDDFSHRTLPQEDCGPLEQADIFLPGPVDGEETDEGEDYRPIVETDRPDLPEPRRDESRKHYGAYRPLPPK